MASRTDRGRSSIKTVLDELLGHRAEICNDLSRLDLMDLRRDQEVSETKA